MRRAQPERPLQHGTVRKASGKEKDPGRFRVRVVSHRKRLIDPDNLCPKGLIDCLRYAGAIPEDTAAVMELSVSQVKSTRDFTVLEVERL